MVLTVDLGPLPWRTAYGMIEWCVERNIDTINCMRLLEAWHTAPPPENLDWTLTIPEKHANFFMLRWSNG